MYPSHCATRCWYGLLVPARTPGHIVTTPYETGRKIMELPDVRQTIQRQGLDITVKDPQQSARHIKAETELMAKIIRAASIRIE
ncbi:MAG: hypothetical protein HY525_18610 [Betaproteobacteria bacterium]|nr:hypothetical protein [Betaproteobacteria bacterium]